MQLLLYEGDTLVAIIDNWERFTEEERAEVLEAESFFNRHWMVDEKGEDNV